MKDNNHYYASYQPNIAATHGWRTVPVCLPAMGDYLKNSESLKILDVGCGLGSITDGVFANYGNHNSVIGVDTPHDLINSCNGRCQTTNDRHNSISFVQGSVYSLPFDDESFDVVYAHQVLLHLENPVQALQ